MSESTCPVRVFVSSPSNLRPERLLVVTICRELRISMGVSIEPLLWEGGGPGNPDVPAFPSEMTGEGGAQAVIDRRLWDELGVGLRYFPQSAHDLLRSAAELHIRSLPCGSQRLVEMRTDVVGCTAEGLVVLVLRGYCASPFQSL